jgi:flagellar hook-basal body complex protein FliE
MQINPSDKMQMIASSLAKSPSSPTAAQEKNVFQLMLADVNGLQRQADTQVRRSLLGEADVHDATLALEKADLSLRLLVQVRNKLVQAYEELSRMAM